MTSIGFPADAPDLLDTIRQAVAALADLPVADRGGDAGERIETLSGLRARLDAQLLAELATFEARGGHQTAGCRSAGGWVRLHLRQTHTAAGHTVGLARTLASLPATAAALAAGEIGRDHAEAIAAGIHRVGTVELGRHEHTLVQLARSAEIRAAITEIARLIDAESGDDDADRRAAEAEAARYFSSRRVGDQVVFCGALDLAAGEALTSYLDAHAAPVPGADGSRDERTPGQRRADAFTQLVHTAVNAPTDAGGMPERLRSTAAVTMTLSLDTLLGLDGAGPLLERLGAVPEATARRLLCDGTLTRIILDPAGDPIDITGCGRAHTTGQAKALALLHPTCSYPGCGTPFRACHIHHIIHWVDGGPTELANLLPLCGTHHRHHHEGGYTITVHPGRRFTFTDPHGRAIPDPDTALRHATTQLPLDPPPHPHPRPRPTTPTPKHLRPTGTEPDPPPHE